MIDCNVFCDSVFSLIKHCVATLSTSFCRARPIFWCSIPFFSLKCMCVEKNWYECTLVVILPTKCHKTILFISWGHKSCNDSWCSVFSLLDKVTSIMIVNYSNDSTFLWCSIPLLWKINQNAGHWQHTMAWDEQAEPEGNIPTNVHLYR